MTIQYKLVPNKLTGEPNTYLARVHKRGTATMDDIVRRIIKRDSTVGKVDVLGVLEAFVSVVETLLEEGDSISIPLFNVRVTISGVFNGQLDSFDPERHQLNIRTTPGVRLKQALRDVSVVQVDRDNPHPRPKSFFDVSSQAYDSVLTPGGMGNIIGRWLRFDAKDPEQGIFLIAEADKSETRVEVVGKNTLRELFFTIPELAPGDYRLAVRARVSGGSTLRDGLLEPILTVTS
jgi:hypothetical protein